jgi:mannose-1-phosphate guanylyltransferase
MQIVPVILAGGIGERFWPASRSSRPKQLLSLASDKPLIVDTMERIMPLCGDETTPLIVTSAQIGAAMEKTLEGRFPYHMLKEPEGKNTAPAVAAAAAFCREKYGESAVMAVVSADHAISPLQSFVDTALYGAQLAIQRAVPVVYGIEPSRPETGYGYLKLGTLCEEQGKHRSFYLDAFVEKPDKKRAESYLSQGGYLWNSGMFLWRVDVIRREFERSMPALFRASCDLAEEGFTEKALKNFYAAAPRESIDFGIMERAEQICAVEGRFEWDDVGSWSALERLLSADSDGNCCDGGNIFTRHCKDSLISNRGDSALAVVGAENMAVISTGDAQLIISKDRLSELKDYIAEMKEAGFPRRLF